MNAENEVQAREAEYCEMPALTCGGNELQYGYEDFAEAGTQSLCLNWPDFYLLFFFFILFTKTQLYASPRRCRSGPFFFAIPRTRRRFRSDMLRQQANEYRFVKITPLA